jgi:hypothetical protein
MTNEQMYLNMEDFERRMGTSRMSRVRMYYRSMARYWAKHGAEA